MLCMKQITFISNKDKSLSEKNQGKLSWGKSIDMEKYLFFSRSSLISTKLQNNMIYILVDFDNNNCINVINNKISIMLNS